MHIRTLQTGTSKNARLRDGLIYSCNLLLQLLHKLLLSDSFQWLRTSLNEPNTELKERKFN